MSVDASPNYMISMTVALSGTNPVTNVQGFFQTSMYVPYNMLGQGFRDAMWHPLVLGIFSHRFGTFLGSR